MILHTVNKPGDCLARCLALVAAGDAVLLLEDGVHATMNTPGNESLWAGIPDSVRCFALAGDLAARGISDKMLPLFEVVTWREVVTLTVENDKVISWG